MAVTLAAHSVSMTAVADATSFAGGNVGNSRQVVGMSFQGTGLTAGQRVSVRDSGTAGVGSLLADYAVTGTSAYQDLWGGRLPQMVTGVSIDSGTVAGTWVLTVFFRD